MTTELIAPGIAAERVVCLMVVSARAYFEGEVQQPEDPKFDAAGSIALLEEWLRRENLWEKLSRREEALMAKPAGQWTRKEQVSVGWRAESAGVIAWALGLLEMRPYDTQFRPGHVMAVIPDRGEPTGPWIAKARLRAYDEILEQRDMAELWLWRARKEYDRRHRPDLEPAPGMILEQCIEQSARNGQQDGWFQMIENDFPARGKSYRQQTEAESQLMNSIAWERLYGLNWVCDDEKDWDHVECDT